VSESEDTIEEMDEDEVILAQKRAENMDAIDAIIARAYAGEELSEDDLRTIFPSTEVQSELVSSARGYGSGVGEQGAAWAWFTGPTLHDLNDLKGWDRDDLVGPLEDQVTSERLKELESGSPLTDDEWKIIRDWRSEDLYLSEYGSEMDLLVVLDRLGRSLSVIVDRFSLFTPSYSGQIYLDSDDPYEDCRDEWIFLDWPEDSWMSATEEWNEIKEQSSLDVRP
jgi:hypothetical protein